MQDVTPGEERTISFAEQLDNLLQSSDLTVQDALSALAYTLARLLHGTGMLTDEESELQALQVTIDAIVIAMEGFRRVDSLDGDARLTATLH